MKIQIYIPITDAVKGSTSTISEWYTTINTLSQEKINTLVQVSISPDDLQILIDIDDFKHNYPASLELNKEFVQGTIQNNNSSDIFDEFPEYRKMTLGNFQKWYSNLDEVSRKRFNELQGMIQDNKRK